MKSFVLIDGNAIVHRAFHALPPLTDKNGQTVNAVYGFFSMLLKILEEVKPEYLVICFDRPKPTFRKELYVGYQAHRPKMDDGLVSQMKLLHEALEKMKITIFEVDGYEADDLIGTLSVHGLKHVKEEGGEIIIVSGDRDMLQLVNHHVKVLAPITGITKMIMYDEDEVLAKYGLHPKQIIDNKALVGDASDNYPGVPGVGPKTAKDLLNKYETLENVYSHLNEIENKNLVTKLAEGAESAGLAKKLATIVTDAPITLDINTCFVSKINIKDVREVFEGFGFNSLLKRLPEKSFLEKKESKEQNKKEEKKEEEREKEDEQLGLL